MPHLVELLHRFYHEDATRLQRHASSSIYISIAHVTAVILNQKQLLGTAMTILHLKFELGV
jgi:hypothetical protein